MMQPANSIAELGRPTELKVAGMSCGNCARKVTSAIQDLPGIKAVDVSVEAQRATVYWATAAPDLDSVLRSIKAAGYGVEVVDAQEAESEERQSSWQAGLWVGIGCTVPLAIGEWVFRLGGEGWFRWLSLLLSGVVQGYSGARFYRGAWLQLKARSSSMDTLVALGSTTAFVYSVWALLAGEAAHLYFMEAAAIITLVSAGHWMEARVSAKAAGSLKALMSLTPRTARRRTPDGSEQRVPVADLRPDDVVLLRPGDTIPTDGVVEEGVSSVNESMLTGESLPVNKAAGRELYAGTANVDGRLTMRVTATGEATALAQIIAAVRRAQSSSANIQRLGDRVSSVFVPIVLAVALGAALWWGLGYEHARTAHEWLARVLWTMPIPQTAGAAAFIIGAAVLIIACPCAMGVATPAAIMAAANVAARRGVLIRDGVSLEKAGSISAVVFDKTGTLTTGEPTVAAWQTLDAAGSAGWDETSLKDVAAAVAAHSLHPFSRAVARLGYDSMELTEWREFRGAGLLARTRWNGAERIVRLGSLRWLRKACPGQGTGTEFETHWAGRGASIIGLAIGDKLAALIAVQDELKSNAAEVVQRLERSGIQVFMVTGDNTPTALSVAGLAGIASERVQAETRPEQKAEFVRQLQSKGRRVAFVGDGINDAPALEQAHLGVAVSRASDIAREAADIVLLNSEVEVVPETLALARATLRTIKQNLFWAFFYNAAAVPLAALGFLSPVLCALAMGASDLIVIGNALRLKRDARFVRAR